MRRGNGKPSPAKARLTRDAPAAASRTHSRSIKTANGSPAARTPHTKPAGKGAYRMIGLDDGFGTIGACGHDVRFCTCGQTAPTGAKPNVVATGDRKSTRL